MFVFVFELQITRWLYLVSVVNTATDCATAVKRILNQLVCSTGKIFLHQGETVCKKISSLPSQLKVMF